MKTQTIQSEKALNAKVALVTGASGGIGVAIAKRLAEEGAQVVVHYSRGVDAANEVVAAIEAEGGQAFSLQADVSQISAIRGLFHEIVGRCGKLDILVNNAGIARAGLVADVTEEDYEAIFNLNVRGVLFCLKEAARCIESGGRIINITSSTTVYPGAGQAIYAASKAAVGIFTQVLAQELGERQITVNSVVPGPTSPGMFDNAPLEHRKIAAQSSPLGRLGTPDDIAEVVAFLASDKARWLTGQNIVTNGGAKI